MICTVNGLSRLILIQPVRKDLLRRFYCDTVPRNGQLSPHLIMLRDKLLSRDILPVSSGMGIRCDGQRISFTGSNFDSGINTVIRGTTANSQMSCP